MHSQHERTLVAWFSASLMSFVITALLASAFGLDGARPFVVTAIMSAVALALAWRDQPTWVVTGTPVCAAIIALLVGFPSDIPLWLVMTLGATLPFPPVLSLVRPPNVPQQVLR